MMRFLLFFLLTCAAAFAGEQIFLEPGTPLFRGPEIVGSRHAGGKDGGTALSYS